jgi:DNA-binding beta-propeller fold protein YncE
VTTLSVGRFPAALAVNAVTNKVYVANSDLCGGVTVVDGASGHTTRVEAGTYVEGVAVNSATNRVYVYDPESVTVIDGAKNTTTDIPLPIPPTIARSSKRCSSNPS